MSEKSRLQLDRKPPMTHDADAVRRRVRNRVILKSCLALFVTVDVLLGVLLIGLFLIYTPYFNLRQVDVAGNKRLSSAEVIETSGMESGTNLLTIDLGQIAARLRRHPWIRAASVYRRLPGQLIVEIDERTPRAILVAGKLYYVDEQAEFFTRLLPGDSVDFPLFTGVKAEELRTHGSEIREMIRAGLLLLDQMERYGSAMDASEIAQMQLSLDDGLSLHTRNGQIVVLGKSDYEQKMQRYGRLKNFLTLRGEWHNAQVINLDFEDRALVRSQDKPHLQG